MQPVISRAEARTQSARRNRGGLGALLRRASRRALDVLIPPACLVCRVPLDAADCLCGRCWSSIDFVRPPLCDLIGIPLPFDAGAPSVSAAALANPPLYDRARVVAAYDGTMRALIHGFKYGDRSDATELFGRWLLAAGREVVRDGDLIIPVPLSRMRLLSRRYNQAAFLATSLAQAIAREPGQFSNVRQNSLLLRRRRRTRSQVGLSASERRRNVRGAFAVPERFRPKLKDRGVILVDDVITSGATVDACAKTLKRAGAARVDVVALARVLNPLRPPA